MIAKFGDYASFSGVSGNVNCAGELVNDIKLQTEAAQTTYDDNVIYILLTSFKLSYSMDRRVHRTKTLFLMFSRHTVDCSVARSNLTSDVMSVLPTRSS